MTEQKKQVRKAYPKGDARGSTQTMVSFRLDNKNVVWLRSKLNKGRYLNELIARDIRQSITGSPELIEDD